MKPWTFADGTPVEVGTRVRLRIDFLEWAKGTVLTILDTDWSSSQVLLSHKSPDRKWFWLDIAHVEPVSVVEEIGLLGKTDP